MRLFQWKFTGRFHKLDYGVAKNMILYGSQQPPEYNLSNIRTKVHIIYGTNDYLVKAEVRVIISFFPFQSSQLLSFTLPSSIVMKLAFFLVKQNLLKTYEIAQIFASCNSAFIDILS